MPTISFINPKYYRPDASSSADRFRDLQLVRRSRRHQRRPMLQLREAQSGMWGYAPTPAVARRRPGLRSVRHRRVRDCVRAHAHRVGRRDRSGRPAVFSRTEHPRAVSVRGKRRRARVRRRAMVDGAQRGVAARRVAAHHVQHVRGPAARTADGRLLWAGAHDHHLYRRRDRGLRVELDRGRVYPADPLSARQPAHRRCIGADFRLDRRTPLLRPPDRQSHRPDGSQSICADAPVLRLPVPRPSTTTRMPAALAAATSPRACSIR
jgi:hypothetical protein